jgi:hypothetical protein
MNTSSATKNPCVTNVDEGYVTRCNWKRCFLPGSERNVLINGVFVLYALCNSRRSHVPDAQDDIDRRREQLIAEIEGKLRQRVSQKPLFSIRWSLE